MKRKISKILGVVLSLTLVLSLAVVFFPAPVAGSPGTDYWTTFDYPLEGDDGGWVYTDNITAGPGPIARAIDGTMYAYAQESWTTGSDVDQLFKSTDDGRTWEATFYSDATYGVEGGDITAIACSSIDADIVYLADANYVYKTEDAGATFAYVAQGSLEDDTLVDGATEDITCLAVGYVNDEPHVYFGTANTTASNLTGHVWYIYDVAFGGGWTDLTLDSSIGDCNVYGIGVSPDFDADALVVAIARDSSETFACSNYGASTTWTEVEIWLDDDSGSSGNIACTEASDPIFPSDFDYDDAYEIFVGITGGSAGDVYLVTDIRSYDLDIAGSSSETDIISLDLVGEIGATMLIAGENDVADVWYSDDDGETWENAADYGKPPSGDGPTYVVMDDDFETSDTPTAWAATSTYSTTLEGAVSLTVDGGVTWNQISLIDTDIDTVDDLAVSSGFATDDTLFMLTKDSALDSVWRYDGANWERVYASSIFNTIDLVAVSPEFTDDETLFVAEQGGTPIIFRSTDKGQTWGPTAAGLRNEPDKLYGWVIIDADTIITGGQDADNEVYKTENYGRRAWDEYAVPTGVDDVISFALSPAFDTDDTIILGDDDAQVYLSDDAGESWEIVYAAFGDAGDDTYVGFDPDFATNNTIYAAAMERIARYQDVTDEDCLWETFTSDNLTTASGMAVVAGNTVYVSDSTAVALTGTTPVSGGIQRSVNPLTDLDYVSSTEFELVGTDIDAGATLNSLQLTSGSNVLWAVDISTATIWHYDDTLAVPVVLTGPEDGSASRRTGYVSLSWTGLDSATMYEIAWDYDPDFIYAPTYAESGTTYYSIDTSTDPLYGETIFWMVRVGDENDAGAPVLSKWSEVRSFTVALGGGQWNPFMTALMIPGNVSPVPGATDAPLMPDFQWNAADWATGYEFVLADNADFISPIISRTVPGTTTGCEVELSYNTSYHWKVRAVSATSASEWAEGVFHTIAKPVAVAPPVEITEVPAPQVTVTQPSITPGWIYAIIAIGAALAVLVIVLIIRTRRVP